MALKTVCDLLNTVVSNKLVFGDNHIFSIPGSGTLESIKDITVEDLKVYYKQLSPKNASLHIAGAIFQDEISSYTIP